ncbi:RRP12-like protein isoform 1 [Homo sapiens]|uniref:RRP12-like protein n=1 Tax=Homo sapiens TaxID=9606 RepID=RRP12_HUMAN|nr:RRP12-like protein isoform 1 [Homo sapiens]Q5JTH9.2 RecName: Full=RRP12-like protein [Homo sapiens]7WTS_K Chain K, RRP12-like protein [Homo sapiens]7WTT_K Chain K, RRP12-like protein [Homo sapiens]7WTU_K Chain K, RRP12-like protein [Homo sapiens]7WTV_K Chain K, RRP12-like protein [Homo sapiens]7WTW_K Chain K, RRP12-like protein [Homo sapiens]7WTX_K Chain K, RRP12-like protein [Homo sapiens]7WTZ_K Chain K, RRP12-like protein [Homo sapiens]7WU0_K Chain K, RRP12-like protein [Homo sapiens]|eukprot:NP_055994.2 RRP12-like protein isoform 1 [Homo sapiens]
MGRSGKLPSGVSAKLKRWKKGHSSDSNPAICRHRQAARSRFFSRPSGRSDLTVDAVKLHNELQSGSLRLGKSEAPETPMEEEAELVLTEKSSGTFLSGLSDCTNVTFSKVQRFWESNSAAHKEICAVLAAVTEVIRSQGGKETETEYFAALMTTMEAVESPESLAAVAYLLNLVLKRVPSPVLIKKFSDTSKAFMDIMSAQASSGSTSVLRWVLSCLATLLRKQDLEAWGYPVTLQVYHGLLSFTVHPKPKIRKAAQHGVCSVLKGSEFMFEKAPAHHPAAISTAKFCIQEIEKSGGSKEATTTLHMLTLLKDLLPCFPEGLVKSCSETLLRVMTLSHVLVTACAMQAFHSLFHARPGLSTLSAELNAQIITALYDYVPSENDLQPLLAWLKVMEKAHINLVRLQWDLGLGHLPRFFGTAVTCLLSPHSQVLTAATQSLKEILKECVAPHMADIGSVTSSASGPAQSVAKMFRAVEEGLTYKFHAAWSSVLQLLCVFFEACGRQAHPVMRKCLQSLCDLRLSPHFPHTAALDQAVGAAVTSMGPEVVLQAVPLEIDGSEETLDFPRSWLLPVIRDHVQETRLGFFTTYFLPLANTLKSKAMDLAQAGSTVESKIYDTLQWQMWTLLPGFCTRPTDVAISFKGLARTLGMAISERPDLRVTVCQALRTLITKGCQAEADRAEVSRFAKNFLPILFNLYGQPVAAGDTPAPRRAVLETIRTYLTITDTQLVNSLLEKASEKVLDPASSDFTRLSVLDLVVALAPCADEAAISKLYSTIRPYLESKAHGVQKKAYRVLEEVCASPQGPGALFVQSHLEDLKKTLLDSLRSTSSPAKRPRLKCLLHIVRKLSAEHKEFITALIPEVILCTKEVSVGARKNAFALLVEMGHAFLRFGSNQEEALQCYLVLIYPGLVGAVTMVSCSILALTHLLFEFKGLMGTSTVEQLLENVCLLLASRTRDVVKSALGFIKVAVTVMDVAHLAKHVQLVMEAIGKLSDDMRRHFRMKLRNLFTKFIRKFGFELVKRLLPEEYHRVLVNIRKAEARAKRHRALSQAAVEEEEEEEEEEEPAQGKGDSIEEILADSEDEEDNEEEERSRGKEQRKLARQRSRAWLKEGGGDEPLNFLDPKVAQRVLATQPGPGRGRKKDHGFKVSADGRLIIREEADGNKMEEEEGAKGEDEEMADPMEDVIIRNKKHQKLKHQKEAEEEELEIPPQYQAGGSGIHRPVAKKAMPGAEYKAKKAKGDVKKKGRPDPYAYIPLNRSKLNRRKKMKLQGQFKGLVKAARRGSQVGHKNRRKDRRP